MSLLCDAIVVTAVVVTTVHHLATYDSGLHTNWAVQGLQLDVVAECRGRGELHAYWRDGDECVMLLAEREECSDEDKSGHFVLNATSGKAYCAPSRPCEEANTFLWANDSRYYRGDQVCKTGETLYLSPTGFGECDCLARFFYWPLTDSCYDGYTRGPCSEGQYFVLDEHSTPVCRPSPCPDPDSQLMYRGVCLALGDSCDPTGNSQLMRRPDGDVTCECYPLTFDYGGHEACYKLYERGPCNVGEYLVYHNATVVCADNPCAESNPDQGEALVPWQGGCVELGSSCEFGAFTIAVDPDDYSLGCIWPNFDYITATLSLECAPGSRRDVRGECRERLSLQDDNSGCPGTHYRNLETGACSKLLVLEDCRPGFIRDIFTGRCRQME